MTIIRKFIPAASADLPAIGTEAFKADNVRRVALRCSSANIDRSGEIVEQSGIDLSAYRRNPVVLWQHSHSSPIARAVNVAVRSGNLECEVEFPPAGTSPLADQIYALIRADVVKGVSIGFKSIASIPLDKGNPVKGPQRYTKSELWEISIVTVPANPDAAVTWKYADGNAAARRKAEVSAMKAKHSQDDARARRQRQIDVLKLRNV